MVAPKSQHHLFNLLRALWDTDMEMAKAFKMSGANVSHWRKRGLPRIHAKKIERISNGVVTVEMVREAARNK